MTIPSKNLKLRAVGSEITISFEDENGLVWTLTDKNGDGVVDEASNSQASVVPEQPLFNSAFWRAISKNLTIVKSIFEKGTLQTMQGFSTQPYGPGLTNEDMEVTGTLGTSKMVLLVEGGRPVIFQLGALGEDPSFYIDRSSFQNGAHSLFLDRAIDANLNGQIRLSSTPICGEMQMKSFPSAEINPQIPERRKKDLEELIYQRSKVATKEEGWLFIKRKNGESLVQYLREGAQHEVELTSEELCYPLLDVEEIIFYHDHPTTNWAIPSGQDYYNSMIFGQTLKARGYTGTFSASVISRLGKITMTPNLDLWRSNPKEFYRLYSGVANKSMKFRQDSEATVRAFIEAFSNDAIKVAFTPMRD